MENSDSEPLHWDDVPVFLAVCRSGTLSDAAQLLGIGVATVSRRIERLEAAMGQALFLRHQSGYQLSPEGEAVLPAAEKIEAAMQSLRSGCVSSTVVTGHVRLATAENLATSLIIPSLPDLLSAHPGLSVEIITDVSTVNVHAQAVDLALRMTRPEKGHLKQRKLGVLAYGLYASSALLDSRPGTMQSLRDTPDTESPALIGWSAEQASLPAARWQSAQLQGVRPRLATSSLAGQRQAAISGLGAAVLPHFLARPSGLRCLQRLPELDQDIWLVMQADLAQAPRVRVVADHLCDLVQRHQASLEGSDAPA